MGEVERFVREHRPMILAALRIHEGSMRECAEFTDSGPVAGIYRRQADEAARVADGLELVLDGGVG